MNQHVPASVTAFTAGSQLLGPAVDCFLTERDLAPSTRRVYVLILHRLADQLGTDLPLTQITRGMLIGFLTQTYDRFVCLALGTFEGRPWYPACRAAGGSTEPPPAPSTVALAGRRRLPDNHLASYAIHRRVL